MSHANVLKRAFDPFFEAPLSAWEDFAAYCELVSCSKGQELKAANRVERYFYFILQGSVGIFLWCDHKAVCLDFAFENHFVGDYMSLLTGQPSPLQSVALEETQVLRIKRSDYLALGQTEMGMVLTRAAAEASYISKQQQQIDLLTKSAEQRYAEMMTQQPEWIHRIAQKHLASYLGITPQSFSRIRRSFITKG